MQRLGAHPASCAAGLPGAAGAWPASLQTLSALATTVSGSAGGSLHTSAQLQQEFISLNTLSDNPGATKVVRMTVDLAASTQVSQWALSLSRRLGAEVRGLQTSSRSGMHVPTASEVGVNWTCCRAGGLAGASAPAKARLQGGDTRARRPAQASVQTTAQTQCPLTPQRRVHMP